MFLNIASEFCHCCGISFQCNQNTVLIQSCFVFNWISLFACTLIACDIKVQAKHFELIRAERFAVFPSKSEFTLAKGLNFIKSALS